MKKIMLAVGHKSFEEKLIQLLKDRYGFTGVAPYREAIVSEAIKSKPDIIVIRENLDGLANMTDIIYSLREEVPGARIIFIALDRPIGDEFLATLVSYGVYDLMVGTNIKLTALIGLIDKPNTFSDVSVYATKVTVDEKGNKKVFDTKIIQAPAPAQSENKNTRVLPILPAPLKKQQPVVQTIDEEIPLTFIQDKRLDDMPGELRIRDNNKPNKNIQYDDKFYAPNDYLTKTSRPIKMQPAPALREEPIIKAPIVTPLEGSDEVEFDFVIVDEQGNAIEPTVSKPIIPVVEEPTPVQIPEPVVEVKPLQEVKPVEPPVVEVEEIKPLVIELPKPVHVEPKPVVVESITPEPIKPEPVKSTPRVEEEDDLLSINLPYPQPKPVVLPKPESKPIESPKVQPVVNREEVKKAEPVKPVVVEAPVPVVVAETITSIKKNKFMRGNPVDETVNTLLFVRSEAYGENHSALNVAIKLAKDEHSVLFVECSKESSFNYVKESLSLLKTHFAAKKMCEDFTFEDLLIELRTNPVEYLVVDAHIEDEVGAFYLLNAKRFLLMKQNKPWAQHVLGQSGNISRYAKFAVLVIEEYTEAGISPKVLMNDYRPFGVLKIKDKKETNFFAINAKMPAMLTKKNTDSLEAYRDLMSYIYGKEEEPNE